MENVGGESGCVELISFEHDLRSFPSALDVLACAARGTFAIAARINKITENTGAERKQHPIFSVCGLLAGNSSTTERAQIPARNERVRVHMSSLTTVVPKKTCKYFCLKCSQGPLLTPNISLPAAAAAALEGGGAAEGGNVDPWMMWITADAGAGMRRAIS